MGDIYLNAERASTSRVVVRYFAAGDWQSCPGWRFFRNVLRIGLYMHERERLRPGDRVVTFGPLDSRRVLVEWAAVAQGATVATLGADASDEEVAACFRQLSPRLVFVSGPARRERAFRAAGTPRPAFVVLDGAPEAGGTSWAEATELGATLDTAERANELRQRMQGLDPEMPAVACLEDLQGNNHGGTWQISSQSAFARDLADFWRRMAGTPGGLVYAVEPAGRRDSRIAVWAAVADPRATLVIGTPGKEQIEIDEIRPRIIAGRTAAVQIRSPKNDGPGRLAALWSEIRSRTFSGGRGDERTQ